MASIGRVAIQLEARTAKFSRGVDRAGRDLKKFRKESKLARLTVLGLGAAMVGFTTRSLSRFNSGIGETIDKLGKTSARLGISVEALQDLQNVAGKAGVSTEKLNMGLQRMIRRVAEAAQGTGVARDALKQLGLDAVELSGMTPDQAFLRIADALEQVENQGDKVALAFKLFDSEGVGLINLMRGGSRGIRDLAQQTAVWQRTLNSTSVARVEQANDAMADLKGIVNSAAREIHVNLTPSVILLREALQDAGITGNSVGGLITQVFQGLTFTTIDVIASFKHVEIAMLRMQQTALGVTAAISGPLKTAASITGALVSETEKLFGGSGIGGKVGTSVANALLSPGPLVAQIIELEGEVQRLKNTDFAGIAKAAASSVLGFNSALSGTNKEMRSLADIAAELGDLDPVTGVDAIQNELQTINQPQSLAARTVRFGFETRNRQNENKQLKALQSIQGSGNSIDRGVQQIVQQLQRVGQAVTLSF